MDLKNLKVAYRPYHPSCAVPGDRRRFIFYAKEKEIEFEIADPALSYDIVYLTYGCDIAAWLRYKKKHPGVKMIFELIDSYLMEDAGLFTFFRGTIRYFTKKESRWFLNYKVALRKMLSVCDAVVCSTPIQKEGIEKFNNNIHISLDYFSDDITVHKENYCSDGKLKLVWEGQAYTVRNVLAINEALTALKEEVELHIITDPVIRYPIRFFNKRTKDIIKSIGCTYYLHDWERSTFSGLIAASDLSIIPIMKSEKLMWNKPENKLLLLWETGVPVFTSPTPAYKRVMENAGFDGLCADNKEWVSRIRDFAKLKETERSNKMTAAKDYLASRHSKEQIIRNWDAIFASVLN